MEGQIVIPGGLYEDEAVCFIAGRYHVSPERIVACFLVQEGLASEAEKESGIFPLEDNEMEILRGLAYRNF